MHVDIQPFIYFSFPKSTIYNQIYVKVQVFVFVFFTQLLWRCIKILLKPWLIKVWELFRCLIYFSIDWYLFQGLTHNFNFFFNSSNQLKDFYYLIIISICNNFQNRHPTSINPWKFYVFIIVDNNEMVHWAI